MPLGVPGALVVAVTGGFELERGVLDVEVSAEALAEPVEHLPERPS